MYILYIILILIMIFINYYKVIKMITKIDPDPSQFDFLPNHPSCL